jgi:hypothetical protein
MKRIENVQKKVLKYCCSKVRFNDLNYNYQLRLFCFYSVETRRKINILKLIQRIKLKDPTLSPIWISSFTFYEQRRFGTKIKIPKTRIKLCDDNFWVDSSLIFNHLPAHLRENNSYTHFMKELLVFYDLNHFNWLLFFLQLSLSITHSIVFIISCILHERHQLVFLLVKK